MVTSSWPYEVETTKGGAMIPQDSGPDGVKEIWYNKIAGKEELLPLNPPGSGSG